MSLITLHPYFKINPGQIEAFHALLPQFVSSALEEESTLYYDFTQNGDEVLCREAYPDAEAVLYHLERVAPLIQEALKISVITRLEIHGPAEELAKLKDAFAGLNPIWFTTQAGPNLPDVT